MNPAGPPPPPVLAAFGADGAPRPLAGGQGTSWHAGNLVLKPAPSTALPMLAWLDRTARPRLRGGRLRIAIPVAARDGALLVGGWQATPWLPGTHPVGRWAERADVARRFAAAFGGVDPAGLPLRDDPWAVADRAAWGEADGPLSDHPLVHSLVPLSVPSAVVHGDLTGNTLLDAALPPAVLDLSLYARPVEWSVAVLAVDAVAFEGAPAELLDTISADPSFPQLLARALLFRMTADVLRQGHIDAAYDPVVAAVRARLG